MKTLLLLFTLVSMANAQLLTMVNDVKPPVTATAAFDPTPYLAAWWKSEGLPQANGTAVSSWTDAIASIAASQGTGIFKPFATNYTGTNFFARTDGALTYLNIASTGYKLFRNKTNATVFAAVSLINSNDATARFLSFDQGSGAGRAIFAQVGGVVAFQGRRVDGEGSSTTISSTGVAAPLAIWTFVLNYQSATVQIRSNSVQVGASAFSDSGATSDTDSAAAIIGGLYNQTPQWNGHIGDMAIVTNQISATITTNIELFLRAKYGLP